MTYEPLVEALINGEWVPLPVRYGGAGGKAILIDRGRKGDASGFNPGLASFAIDNTDASFSPRNALGQYYGYLKRNTPVRIYIKPHNTTGSMIDVVDTFTRSETATWGSATPTGGAYSTLSAGGTIAASNYDVNGSQGTHFVPAALAYRATFLGAQEVIDSTQSVDFSIPQATGADLETGLMFRGTSSIAYVHMRAHLTTANAIILRIYNAASTLLGEVTTGLTHAGTGTPLRLVGRVLGTRLQMKVYDPAGADPGWQLSVTDTRRPERGWVGIRSGRANGNTNSTDPQFSYDSYSVVPEDARFFGEIPAWPVNSDKTGNDVIVNIDGAGVTRRLTQGRRPLRSAAYTRVMAGDPTPIAYWPLEDGERATAGNSEIAGVPNLSPLAKSQFTAPGTGVPFPPPGIPKFSEGLGSEGSDRGISLKDGGLLTSTIPLTTDEDSFEVTFNATFDVNGFNESATVAETIGLETGGSLDYWSIDFGENVVQISAFTGGRLGTFVDTVTANFNAYDGAPHVYNFWVNQVGGNVEVGIIIDDVQLASDTFNSQTQAQPTKVTLNIIEERGAHLPSSFNHLAVFAPFLSIANGSELVDAYHGHLGETAADRLARLGTQIGVPVHIIGTNADTTPMGPQQVGKTFIEYATEAVNTDGGLLLEARTHLGYLYRTRSDLISQSSICDFVYGDFMDFPRPLPDDHGVRNLLEVTNYDRTTVTYEDTDGPLGSADPEDGGIGVYDEQLNVNALNFTYLPNIAAWNVNRSTLDVTRFDALRVGLHKEEFTGDQTLLDNAKQIDTDGNLITFDGLPDFVTSSDDTNYLLVVGIIEDLDQFEHYLTFNAVPALPWLSSQYDDGIAKYDSSNSFVETDFDAGTDTSLSVEINESKTLWVTGGPGGQFPIEITIGGLADLNVTAISGASSPQTFTVDAATLNGFTGTISAGATVKLRKPARYIY